jgi:hypothetical protein
LQSRQLELLDSIVEPVTPELAQKWLRLLDEQIDHIQAVIELRRQGLVGQRARRRSKRVALGGLPPDWREQLCHRGSTGRYADALLLAALSGCRPSELERGIEVSRVVSPVTGQSLIEIVIDGTKVKKMQGQPIRRIRYAEDDEHPLVLMLKGVEQLSANAHGRPDRPRGQLLCGGAPIGRQPLARTPAGDHGVLPATPVGGGCQAGW